MKPSKPTAKTASDQDDLVFAEDDVPATAATNAGGPSPIKATESPWQILIVDDEPEVHQVTKLALRSLIFEDRPLAFTSAHSGQEARDILRKQQDFAVALVDVIMETDDAGLDLVRFIREELRNKKMRVVLRTGQPGAHQERAVMIGYEINDYKTKTELTKEKLESSVVASLRTVTHIERIENLNERLQLSAKLTTMGEFSMGMVHEIATPLTTMMCMNDVLRERLGEGHKDLGEMSARIQRAGLRIKRLIENLKNFSWSGGEPSRAVTAHELIENAVELCEFKMQRLGVLIEIACAPELIISCRQRQVEQVLINLISNACDAVAPQLNKRISVVVGRTEPMICFDIIDTGPGVPEHLKDRIFDSFFTTKPRGQGTGLGLLVSKNIAEEHGGTVSLKSTSPGGATFRLTLPAS